MTKTKKTVLILVTFVIICLLGYACIDGASRDVLECPECHNTGVVKCEDCDGTGLVDGEMCENCAITCETCEGEGEVDGEVCADCNGEGVLPGDGTLTCEFWTDDEGGCVGESRGSWWALLPPIIAIGLALITKEVYSSLAIGVVSGGILYAIDAEYKGLFGTFFHPLKAMSAITEDGLIAAVKDTAGVFIFLIELGIIVALVNKSGGSQAFGKWAATHIKTRVGAMIATFILGVLIFIDDYFNCLTVGSVMKPVTDGHKISRAKFAYLIDATAAPVCMIAPISSWAAAVSSYADDGQGLNLFIAAIPYNFYSLLTFVFIIAICVMGFDYGSMAMHEYNAQYKDDLYTTGERVDKELEGEKGNPNGKVIDLVLPIVALIVISVFALIYNGGFYDNGGETYHKFIDAFGNTDATVGLPWAGAIALVFTIVYLMLRKIINFKESMEAVPKGFIAMVAPILILTFATALKNMTMGLGAKYYVATLMTDAATSLTNLLPAIIFLVACFLSFSTGTSWGTFGILIPIVQSIFTDNPTLLVIGISACLAGAVCGDHCSPISDTTIMSSAGAQCNHINHVSTQLPYALTVAGVSFVSFIIAGFVQSWYISLPIAVAMMLAVLFAIRFITKNGQQAEKA